MFISGTEASLTIPRLQIYSYKGKRGWHEPLTLESTPLHNCDPYSEQLRHLRAVTEGLEKTRMLRLGRASLTPSDFSSCGIRTL
jgi:hypothetical protein